LNRNFFRAVNRLIWKDLRTEWRSREMVSAMLVFSLVDLLVFNFALELEFSVNRGMVTGILWVTQAFAGTLGISRSFSREKEQGNLEGLLLAPVDRFAIYLAKLVVNWVVILIVTAILVPAGMVLFNVNLLSPLLILVVLLGTLGYVEAGTLLAGMAVQTRMRDLVLPVILLPVVIPLFLAAVRASRLILGSSGIDSTGFWIAMIAGFDIIFFVIAYLLFGQVIKE